MDHQAFGAIAANQSPLKVAIENVPLKWDDVSAGDGAFNLECHQFGHELIIARGGPALTVNHGRNKVAASVVLDGRTLMDFSPEFAPNAKAWAERKFRLVLLSELIAAVRFDALAAPQLAALSETA